MCMTAYGPDTITFGCAVLNSPKGAEHGGTLFCQPKVWNDPAFPRHLFHQGKSKRQGIPAHTKQIIALHSPAEPGGKYHGYLVQGSHNFTGAAWGNLQHPRGPQSEWECGEGSAVARSES